MSGDDIEHKRDHVMGMGHTTAWKTKVRKMSDAQVIAIYLRDVAKAQERGRKKAAPKKESPQDDAPF